MFQLFIRISQLGVLGLWAIYAASFVLDYASPWNDIVFWGGIVLFLVHLSEYIVLRNRIAAAAGEGSSGIIGTMIFGYGYWLPLLRKS
ncbi:hypothetical protein MIB92_12240 [Aestuariirhabdus sp. Z084]|uniref:hypothetical protein n=1 Tax=Aestuariirhabdus haliotis TaxID=2918751 RepID=UPI00201B396C|nr:hypothetical protein [Aestuariirhabdus haliotis]MCL6416423.1 hypothetical protein [Aestuariirhabdus haliotis]MCL6420411.1 hypothetical protein [Aestuariirhabdus haliotis]